MGKDYHEALALLEIDGMATALAAQDMALKQAKIKVLACAPVSPGKVIIIMAGPIAEIEESTTIAIEFIGSRLIDHMLLPGIHPGVLRVLDGHKNIREAEALAIVEFENIATTLRCADSALKCTDVMLGRLHLASGFGGRGFFTLWGKQPDVEVALEEIVAQSAGKLLDHEVIPAPHGELAQGAFTRPWSIDPCA
ncbi:MAG: BMC domain-containing protein [Myxococcota bacterium]|jgi:microcompartment protein CcmL/EutN|nr:BMC domain-containing protein [Myxococcota bacterium]